jgi:hypothetical protein
MTCNDAEPQTSPATAWRRCRRLSALVGLTAAPAPGAPNTVTDTATDTMTATQTDTQTATQTSTQTVTVTPTYQPGYPNPRGGFGPGGPGR